VSSPGVNVATEPGALLRVPRAVAIGTFDGVHLGHRAVIRAAVDAGPAPTVVTFDPHPRAVLGRPVELLATLERRLELFAECGVTDVLVIPFRPDVAALEPDRFARDFLLAIGAEVVVAGAGFRFGRERSGDLELLRSLGLDARTVPLVEGVSSTRIRSLVHAGDVEHAARLLGRAVEVEGVVVGGDHRGTGLGFPTANLDVPENLLVPANGIYAGAVGGAAGRRAAVSVGVNPHYGGGERRVEAFLLDWSGDLYGERLVVQLWQRLRDERAFPSEAALVEQIARDVEETRAATPPV
jgi:riboflavin kinase / FMN adenylyltransferase